MTPSRKGELVMNIEGVNPMYKLVLIRHGESTWNKENLFTGWTDVDLSEKGVEEATEGGRALKEQGYIFDIAFTSVLKRAIRTLWIVMDEMDLMWIPVYRSWRLNERPRCRLKCPPTTCIFHQNMLNCSSDRVIR